MRLKTGKAPTAEGEILVNEEFVRAMKWDNNGVGEYVPEHGTVTGILDGFRFIDAAQMEPVEIRWSSGRGNVMHVRLKEPFDDNLKRLNEEMKKLYPQDNVQFTSYANRWNVLSIQNAFSGFYHFGNHCYLSHHTDGIGRLY